MNASRDFAALLGRIFIALLFVPAGWGKISGFAGTAGYIASKGLPLPEVGAAIAIAVELVGGLLLLVGFKTRWAAAAIFLFLIPTTVFFHPFWADPTQATAFWKNIAIMGGLLYVWSFGAGRLSIDKQ